MKNSKSFKSRKIKESGFFLTKKDAISSTENMWCIYFQENSTRNLQSTGYSLDRFDGYIAVLIASLVYQSINS